MVDLQRTVASDTMSRREAADVRGKLVNYGQCMEGTRQFAVPFTVFIGSPASDYEWDEKLPTPEPLRSNAAYLLGVIPRLERAGAPIWRLEAATVFDRWQRGTALPFPLVVVTYDAVVYGLAVSVRTRPESVR